MVDSHHLTPAEADEGDQRRERRTIGPYIKDTNFRLGGTEGGVNDGYEGDPLLQDVAGSLGRGDGGQVGVGGSELNALAGKREERLEDPGVAAELEAVAEGGIAVELIEKEGPRHGGVVEEGDGELADVEVPVGVASPFDVERFPVVELEGHLFAKQLVDDGAIVDATDGDEVFSAGICKATELAGGF